MGEFYDTEITVHDDATELEQVAVDFHKAFKQMGYTWYANDDEVIPTPEMIKENILRKARECNPGQILRSGRIRVKNTSGHSAIHDYRVELIAESALLTEDNL